MHLLWRFTRALAETRAKRRAAGIIAGPSKEVVSQYFGLAIRKPRSRNVANLATFTPRHCETETCIWVSDRRCNVTLSASLHLSTNG